MCLIEDQSWIDCIDITSRWDTFVLYHLYGNKGVSLPLWPIRPRWFHTFCPYAEPLGDGYEGMWARFGSQGSIALNWHSRYSGPRYSGTWLYVSGHLGRPVLLPGFATKWQAHFRDLTYIYVSSKKTSTVRCRYNAINFIKNIHKRHPIARPLGRGMGRLLWIQPLIDILPQFLRWCMQYLVIFDRVITALDCT